MNYNSSVRCTIDAAQFTKRATLQVRVCSYMHVQVSVTMGQLIGVQGGLRLAYSYVNTGNNNMSCDLMNNNKTTMNNSI